MNDYDLNDEQDKLHENRLIGLVDEWARTYNWYASDKISAAMASTSAIFDVFDIEIVRILDASEHIAIFFLRCIISGKQQGDAISSRSTIVFLAEGIITDLETSNEWKVTSITLKSVEISDDYDSTNWIGTRYTTCNTIHDLLFKISTFPKEWWWRGHGLEDWDLKPSVARRTHATFSLEKKLMLSFESESSFLSSHTYSIEPYPHGIAKLNFVMQHHGLPTRLLDWSSSPLTALYFAVCHEELDGNMNPACLWVIDPVQLNRVHGQAFPYISTRERDDIFKESSERVLALHAPYIDLRMKVQQSQFTVHANYSDLQMGAGSSQFLKEKINIPSFLRKNIRKHLARLGVTRASLFPDLDSIAKSIKEERLG